MAGFRFTVITLAVVIFAGVSAVAAAPTQNELESVLKLRCTIDRVEINPWDEFTLTAEIVNTSDDTSYSIVLPGDGSFSGRALPSIRYNAERYENDQWKPFPAGGGGFCGVYDSNWLERLRILAPGQQESILSMSYLSSPSNGFSKPGRYRVSIVYSFRANIPSTTSFGADETNGYGAMEGYPSHTLVSEPVEFVVPESPVEVRIVVRDDADILDADSIEHGGALSVSIVNHSDEDFEIACQSDARPTPRLGVWLQGKQGRRFIGGGGLEVVPPQIGSFIVPAHGEYKLQILRVSDSFNDINLVTEKDLDEVDLIVSIQPGGWPRPLVNKAHGMNEPSRLRAPINSKAPEN